MSHPTTPESHQAHVRVVFGALMLVVLLAALDQTIVATALPTIVGELGGLQHISWVVTAYLLAQTVVTPLYGKLGDLYGRKVVLQVAIVIFLAGSVLCGFAQGMVELILFRAIQGFGGGGLMVTAQATVGDIVPPQERGRYQGLFGAVFGVATVIGPLMGGFFVEQLSWRWIFYVNVPLGILSLGVIAVSLRAPVTRRAHVIDYPGAALIAVALTCLVLATSLGGTTYAWSSPQILGLIGAGLFLAGVFVLVERHAAEPVLPLELFRNRVFTVASMTGLIVGFALFGSVTFMPLYLQVVQGKSPTTAGLLMSPMMAGLLVTSIASGRLIMRVGRYKPFPIAGTAITTVGLLLLSRLDAGSSLLAASLSMLVLGLGLGAVMQVLVLAVQNAVDYEHLGVATSGTTLFRSIGGSIGVSVFGAIFANQLHGNLSAELGGKATQLPNTLEPRALNALPSALHHAYVVAFAEALHPVFLAAAAVALLAFALTWLLREQPLRRTVEGSGPSESFAVPRDQTSLEEIERALTSLASRENRVRLYQRLATRAGLDLSPRATWLLARLGEAPETDRADLSQRFRLEPDRLELAIEELAVAGLAADGGRVTLTPSGSAAHTRLVAARREGLAELLTEWSPEEHADVAAMLSRLARAMTAEAPRPPVSATWSAGMTLRRLLGADIDRELLPVLAVTFVSTAALSAHFGFQGIYAIRELGASPSTFAWTLLVEASLTIFVGYLGGHLSDRYGRRPVMLISWAGQAVALGALALVHGLWAGLALIVVAGMLGGPGRSAAAALVADIVPEHRQEAGYAAQRVAENLAVATGPPLGGLVLLSGSWAALYACTAGLVVVALVMGARLLPNRLPHPHARHAEERGNPLRLIRRDHAFMLFLVASTLASLAFIASETVLPIAAVTLYGLSPSTWGLIAILNPLAVVLFQMRITRWTEFIPTVRKLVTAMLLMGAPLLLLPLNLGVWLIVAVIAIFVIGEMLWVPSSQAIIARLAPADVRGAYMGAVSSAGAAAFALGPMIGLQLLEHVGDSAMWSFYAAACGLAAIAGAAAARQAERRRASRLSTGPASGPVPAPPAEAPADRAADAGRSGR